MGLEHRYLEMFAHARDGYARQQPGGRGYTRVEAPLTPEVVRAHLSGEITLGLYLLDERDTVRYGVLDHDGEQVARDAWGMPLRNETGPAPRIYKDGEAMLQEARALLAREGIAAAVERSRRGAHLWLFAAESVPARDMRALLLLAAPDRALEVYPRQDSRGGGVGSMIRAPLGIHRTSGARYGFVGPEGEPVASTLAGQIAYLEGLPRVDVTAELARRPHLQQIRAALDGSLLPQVQMVPPAPVHPVPGWEQGRNAMRATMRAAIRAWVESVRLEDVVGAYIPLSRSGLAHCPWPEHHKNGDAHPSFVVLTRIQRWRCYASGQHGDAFDFVARMEGHANARETLAYVRRRWPSSSALDM